MTSVTSGGVCGLLYAGGHGSTRPPDTNDELTIPLRSGQILSSRSSNGRGRGFYIYHDHRNQHSDCASAPLRFRRAHVIRRALDKPLVDVTFSDHQQIRNESLGYFKMRNSRPMHDARFIRECPPTMEGGGFKMAKFRAPFRAKFRKDQ